VTEFVIDMLVAVPVLFLWLTVVALVVRPFGVRLRLGPFSFRGRKSAFQTLTFSQFVLICGVLHFGCGLLITTIVSRYLEWKYFNGSSGGFVTGELLRDFVTQPLIAGVLFGLVAWNRSPDKQ
jgi:hypothetical protein